MCDIATYMIIVNQFESDAWVSKNDLKRFNEMHKIRSTQDY